MLCATSSMLSAKLLAPGRCLARYLGSRAPPSRGALQQMQAATFARDPGAAPEPPYWYRQQLNVLQRASQQHGIASNSTTRQQHSSRGGKPPPSASLASDIRALGKQRRWQGALQMFKTIKKPTALEMRAVLEAMALSHQHRHAMMAMNQLRGSHALTAQDYELAIIAHVDRAFGAVDLLRAMEGDGIRWTPCACGAALRACGKAGRMDTALQVIGEMTRHGVRPHSANFLGLIKHCVRDERSESVTHAGDSRGGSSMAAKLLQLMQDLGVVRDIRHFDVALRVCAWERSPHNASIIFQRMAPQGIVPNVQNWNALLDAIGRAGQIDAMLEKYREMRTSGQRPDRFTMHTMLSNAAAAGRCDIAQATWMEMRDVQMEPEARNYNAMINCYATAEEPEKAEEVLAEMCESASVKPDVLTFSSLMKAYIVVGRLDEAESVISRMRAAGVEPDLQTWKSIIHAADAARDVKRADQLYSELLLSGTFKPYKSWRNSNIKDVSGKRQPKGTVMDLHKTNPGTGRAAIRHELQLQRSSASERTTPLYIITGQGAGLLRAAVSDALNAQGIHHLLPAAHPGRIIIPPTRIHSR
eukprot:TRINITY_DN583_c0_g1_i1.p1 TRINITY_DN583_c0_g1~~TRINITY_DN583_c0_g1_i1.p1  ORF type:complete len:586 (+),score=76.89 TRINITY_DN583_c0_g1_i1:99-1856(+)